jgi:diadenosine tetraphosphate (Ap4A) HIT family hydrolase
MSYAQELDREIADARRRSLKMYRELRAEDPAKARAMWRLLTKAQKALKAQIEADMMRGRW